MFAASLVNTSKTYYSNNEGHTGVFSWCVISWFYFPWNVNLGNSSSWSVTWRFCLTCEELELFTVIRDFTNQFYVILRSKSSEWLESSIESDLDMWFAIWSLAFQDFSSFKTLSSVRTGYKKEYLAYFRDSRERNFNICDPWSSVFPAHEPTY